MTESSTTTLKAQFSRYRLASLSVDETKGTSDTIWPYYGSKFSLVKYYPRPMYPKIIEPFAGTANYALRYWERDVLLVDAYPVIVEIWKYLQGARAEQIKALPVLKRAESVVGYTWSCDAEKALVGFCIGSHVQVPRKTASARTTTHRPNRQRFTYDKLAANVEKIKHWDIRLGSYLDIPNEEATWFIDPPYQFGGEHYVKNNKTINYSDLAEWCKTRKGQVIVCENTKADWLPFKPMKSLRGNVHTTTEALWCNHDFDYQMMFEIGF